MPPFAVSRRVQLVRSCFGEDLGEPDEVWQFPRQVFNRATPPLDYVEVAAWDRSMDDAEGGPRTLFVTAGMSDAPRELLPAQTPTELMVALPTPMTKADTNRVALWLAVCAFQPFVSGRPFVPFDVISLVGGVPNVPELDGFAGLAFVPFDEIHPAMKAEGVQVLGLFPISEALAAVRREQGQDMFRELLLKDVEDGGPAN